MFYRRTSVIVAASMLMLSATAYGQDISREQMKGQDEQIQEIKGDVLSISAELNRLEEKLLYPSDTEVSVFVSLAGGETFRLDSVDVQMDGKPVARHIYSFKELEALKKGGVQRIYTGNIRTGDHELQFTYNGKTDSGYRGRVVTSIDVAEIREAIVTQICPWCGKGPFAMLAVHTNKAHDIDKWQLRELAGYTTRQALCAPDISEKMRQAQLDNPHIEKMQEALERGRKARRWTTAGINKKIAFMSFARCCSR